MPYHVVLVHGTGARGAAWTREATSALCGHLKAELVGPCFSHCDWSGKNLHRERVDGARKLLAHVKAAVADDHSLVLVGHSHGGTVIAQALVSDEDLCRRLAGVVFLSTPFLHARLLPLAKHLPKGPALLVGVVCAVVVVLGVIAALVATTDWPETPSRWLSGIAFAAVFAGLFVWGLVFDRVTMWLGRGDPAGLISQLDLGLLDTRGVNQRALIVRSTADEAAGGLAAAQVMGRIASDVPALVWKAPAWIGRTTLKVAGFRGGETPRWFLWTLFAWSIAWFVGGCVAIAAWLAPGWEPVHTADRMLREVADRVIGSGVQVWVWVWNIVVLVLLTSVPLTALGAPFKLVSLLAYGLRGWPVLRAMLVELSVEPAPPGGWRLHQLNADAFEAATSPVGNTEDALSPAASETALAHSYIYNDVRAHRLVAAWLKAGCKGVDAPPRERTEEAAARA